MLSMPKVSVIIPVYNTEKYLKKCLDSVCNQTLSDIEIICINDCSSDTSLNILKEYSIKDKRIKIISFKDNKGVSVARNVGIDKAIGEYVGFIDSDDHIDLDFYEKLYTKAIKTQADCVKGNIKQLDGLGNIIDSTDYDINDEIILDKAFFYHSFTSAIYNRFFLQKHNIFFPEGIIHFEDPYFSIKVSIFCNKILIVDDVNYYYFRRSDSETMNQINLNTINSISHAVNLIIDMIINADIPVKHYVIVHNFLYEYVLNLSVMCKGNEEQYKILLELLKRVKSCGRKYSNDNIFYIEPEKLLNYYNEFNNFKPDKTPKLKILVSYIKPSFLFKNDIFVPIHLGREIEKEISKDGIVSDEDSSWLHKNCIGDNDFEGNISSKNRRVGFLTGTYWAWKNYNKLGNPDYFGSFGYRKLLAPDFLKDLYKYDLILPKKTKMLTSLKKQMIDSHGVEMYNASINIIENVYPAEKDNYVNYLKLSEGYFYELYIMKKNEFFKFCNWIFPILFGFYKIYANSKINNYHDLKLYEKIFATENNNERRDIAFILERITGYYFYNLTTNKFINYQEVNVLTPENEKENINKKIFMQLRKKISNIS